MWEALFQAISRWVRSLFGQEKESLAAVIRSVRRDFHKRLAASTSALARSATAAGRLEVKLDASRSKRDEIRSRISNYRKVERADLVAELDRELEALQSTLDRDEKEVGRVRSLLDSNRAAFERLRREFEEKVARLERLRDATEVKEIQAELASMAGSATREMETACETLRRLEEDLESRHDAATGKARVAFDLVEGKTSPPSRPLSKRS